MTKVTCVVQTVDAPSIPHLTMCCGDAHFMRSFETIRHRLALLLADSVQIAMSLCRSPWILFLKWGKLGRRKWSTPTSTSSRVHSSSKDSFFMRVGKLLIHLADLLTRLSLIPSCKPV